jgi:hypothetical protein
MIKMQEMNGFKNPSVRETVTIGSSQGENSIFIGSLKLLLNRTLLMIEFLYNKLMINCSTERKVQSTIR